MIRDIIELCIKKQWWEADELFEKYLKNCYELWKQYDTLFNYQFNKCGFCRKMKRAIVKQKWSEADNILQKMKLHIYFLFLLCHSLFAFDFVSQVPLHRIPHCDIV